MRLFTYISQFVANLLLMSCDVTNFFSSLLILLFFRHLPSLMFFLFLILLFIAQPFHFLGVNLEITKEITILLLVSFIIVTFFVMSKFQAIFDLVYVCNASVPFLLIQLMQSTVSFLKYHCQMIKLHNFFLFDYRYILCCIVLLILGLFIII